jgi:hypothetical protein
VVRGPSVSQILELHWDYPPGPPAPSTKDSGTSIKVNRKALPLDEALRLVAGNDPRPLLVLRECAVCNKTNDALLLPGADNENERVLFLARWFHCVRLPIDVSSEDHPFHSLFPNVDAEHLFVSARDGTHHHGLESETSRLELCAAMSDVLADSYVKDPTPLYKDLAVFGDQLDALDNQAFDLTSQRSKLMEARVVDRKKLEKVEADLAAVKKKIADKRAEIDKASKIDLKPASKAGTKPG